MKACCAIGMQLLDLHQDFIYDNLVQIMKGESTSQIYTNMLKISMWPSANQATITPDLFWTAGTDEGSEGFFGFATTKTLVPKYAKYIIWQLNDIILRE